MVGRQGGGPGFVVNGLNSESSRQQRSSIITSRFGPTHTRGPQRGEATHNCIYFTYAHTHKLV